MESNKTQKLIISQKELNQLLGEKSYHREGAAILFLRRRGVQPTVVRNAKLNRYYYSLPEVCKALGMTMEELLSQRAKKEEK